MARAVLVVAMLAHAVDRDGMRILMALVAVLAAFLFPVVMVVLSTVALVTAVIPGSADRPPPVPPAHLAVMVDVSRSTGVPWSLLAAIASVESGFGANMSTSWAGAIGYGQFLPSSWEAFGDGGDPYDYHDVVPAMARYLLAAGVQRDIPSAVYAYNHSWDYVALVLRRAAYYQSSTLIPTPPLELDSPAAGVAS